MQETARRVQTEPTEQRRCERTVNRKVVPAKFMVKGVVLGSLQIRLMKVPPGPSAEFTNWKVPVDDRTTSAWHTGTLNAWHVEAGLCRQQGAVVDMLLSRTPDVRVIAVLAC